MASIRTHTAKDGTKTYHVEVRLTGFEPQRKTFTKKSEAMAWGEDVEFSLRNGSVASCQKVASNDMTIPAAVDGYLTLMAHDRTRSRHTILTDRLTGQRIIKGFGNLSLRTLRQADIEEYKLDRLAIVGPSTVRQDLSMLSRIYKVANIKWRFTDLDFPGKNVQLPAPPKERKVIVPMDKFQALFKECKASLNDRLFPLVFLLLNTGMRPEEAVLLKWEQVRFDERIIDLVRTKTEPRRVPLSDDAAKVLREIPRMNSPYVFVDEKIAGKEKPSRHFRRAFNEACIRAGINDRKARDWRGKNTSKKNVTLYSLRHSAATYMLAAGIDLETVRDILGHSNISQTSKYLHMSDAHKIAAVNKPMPWHE